MKTVALARRAMATRFEILLYGEDEVRLRAAGEEALDEVERLEAHLSLYRPASEISRINTLAFREPVRVEPSLFRLLQRAQRLHGETGGTFDITIAPLVRCWGFMGGTGKMPDAEQVAAARARVGMEWVELRVEGFTVRFLKEGMMIDLGAIGKGYAVEQAAEILREAGVASALIHGGTSTVHAIGAPPDAQVWKVAVQSPDAVSMSLQSPSASDTLARSQELGPQRESQSVPPHPGPLSQGEGVSSCAVRRTELVGMVDVRAALPTLPAGEGRGEGEQPLEPPSGKGLPSHRPPSGSILAVVDLKDEAMSVSALHGRSFSAGGKTYGHVIDPKSGYPVQHAQLAAVVLPSATETDALSTALLTVGPVGHKQILNLRPRMRTLLACRVEATDELSIEVNGISPRSQFSP
ncbi:MAG: FAD:protein FMN transferase [Verrucomicrobia bacterium]|nr:FAD:protein FMN transferase [Verrucomicrobiota bacterium]